ALFEVAERVASHGYFVLFPDLLYRGGPYVAPNPRELFSDPELRKVWFTKYISTLTPDNVQSDVTACLDHLAKQPDVVQSMIGVVGYCMGGRLAFVCAANFPDRIAAVGVYHPGGLVTDTPESPHLLSSRIKGRVYVGGAMEDANFTDEHKKTLEAALAATGV